MAKPTKAEVPDTITNPDWPGLLESALTLEGSLGDTYQRAYTYSMGNIAFLMYQGVTPQPVATYQRWQDLGRQVQRGAKAYYILRPITVKLKDELDDEGIPKTIQRFKPVKSVFPLEMTDGEPLPEIEHPDWSKERALGALAIKEVPFETYDGNTQGYSIERDVAISPLAKYPQKTLMHEIGHVVLGHTAADQHADYLAHRGTKEFEAEGTAHLTMIDLQLMTPDMASVSRAYMQRWMQRERPSDKSVRAVFKATDQILRAGRDIAVDN